MFGKVTSKLDKVSDAVVEKIQISKSEKINDPVDIVSLTLLLLFVISLAATMRV